MLVPEQWGAQSGPGLLSGQPIPMDSSAAGRVVHQYVRLMCVFDVLVYIEDWLFGGVSLGIDATDLNWNGVSLHFLCVCLLAGYRRLWHDTDHCGSTDQPSHHQAVLLVLPEDQAAWCLWFAIERIVCLC